MPIGKIKLLALVVAVGFALVVADQARAAGPVALVQSASRFNGATYQPFCQVAFPSANSAGNLIIVAVNLGAPGSDHQAVVTDTQGNRYFPATSLVTWRTNGGGDSAQLFYAPDIQGGPNAVTVSEISGQGGGSLGGDGNAFNSIAVHEYSGLALASPLDAASVSNGIAVSGPVTLSSGTVTTSVDGELIFGYGATYGAQLSAGAGFSLRESPDGVSEDLVQPMAGLIDAVETETASNSPYAMLLAAFRPALSTNGLDLPWQPNLVVQDMTAMMVTNSAAELDPGGQATNTILFTYANRAALVADGWSFIATNANGMARNTETTGGPGVIRYAQTNAFFGKVMRVPCDQGDLYGPLNPSTNSLFRALPANWQSLRLSLSIPPSVNYQQAHVGIYQDDDNYVDVGLVFNSGLGGEAVTFVSETNAVPSHFYSDVFWFTGGPGSPAQTNIFLRLDQDPATGDIGGFFSLDGLVWVFVGKYSQSLVNPRLGIWVGGSPVPYTNGLPVCDVRQLDIVTAPPPPVLSYQLLNPPAGAVIGGGGVINWTPLASQADASYALSTAVTDMASGLSATNSFLVTVTRPLTQPPPKILTVSVANGQAVVTWSAASGQAYELQSNDNLGTTNWNPVLPDVTATGNTAMATNSLANASARFYRILVLP